MIKTDKTALLARLAELRPVMQAYEKDLPDCPNQTLVRDVDDWTRDIAESSQEHYTILCVGQDSTLYDLLIWDPTPAKIEVC